MKTYKSIYPFNVVDEARKGKTVYAVDKAEFWCGTVNSLDFDCFVECLNGAEKEPTRYEFWVVEETEAKEIEE